MLARLALAALHDGAAETTVTLVVPFAAYFVAEHVEGSGVLAVLAVGLYLRTYAHPAVTAGGYLLGRSVWGFVDYLITSVVFVLIGFELTDVLEGSPVPAGALGLAVGVVLLLVAVRFLWMFPAVAIARVRRRRGSAVPAATPYGTRETVVVAWAGMRGVVTVATALALPLTVDAGGAFPERETIVVVGLVAVLATLVVQGLTLSPLVKRLGVGSDADTAQEVAELRRRATQAALQVLDEADDGAELAEPVRQAVRLQYEGYLAAQDALAGARHRSQHADGDGMSHDLRVLQSSAAEAERELVLRARRRGEVSAEVADEVLSDVETRAVRDLD